MTYIQEIIISNHHILNKKKPIFPWKNIPNISIITGINGSGKTKFLDALYMAISDQKRNFNVDIKSIAPIELNEFGYVTWNRGGNSLEGGNPANLTDERRNLINQINNRQIGPHDSHNYLLYTLTQKFLGKPIDISLTHTEEFKDAFAKAWMYSRDFVTNQHIGRLFANYLMNYEAVRAKSWDPKTGKSDNHDEIIKKIGKRPWDIINDLFQKYNFKYQINYPEDSRENYEVKFILEDDEYSRVDFSQLSSGEQMIVTLILWSFDENMGKLKKLLILDEPDAHLHPQMAKMFKQIILDVLIAQFNIQIIITTHSPTTVAVFPEENIFSLSFENGVAQTTKEKAIAILTDGIPTLSIDFKGRRQVFVEDMKDAERFENIYQSFRSELNSERSLVFIGAGTNGKSRTGCDAVKILVNDLDKAGNSSVYGLIDWDTKNEPEGRIHILAYGKRYAIENCVFDPLLIAAAVLREDVRYKSEFAIADNENIQDLPPERLQHIADKVQGKILGHLTRNSISESYVGNFSINIEKSYLEHDPHALENIIKSSYTCFKRHHQEGDLLHEFAIQIIPQFHKFTPTCIKESFLSILNA